MKFILGTKEKMTTVYTEDGRAYAATIIMAGPATVTQVKTVEKDGYNAVQIGFGETKDSRVNKPQLKHFHAAIGGADNAKGKALKHFKELRKRDETPIEGIELGATVDISSFEVGDKVEVSAISKGRGFQGVVKRHGFHGGRRTHGQKHSEREPGSIGGGGRAGGRVAKGMRMAGRMGNDRVTVRNLTVLQVHPETRELVLSGAVPGRRGTLVEIRGTMQN